MHYEEFEQLALQLTEKYDRDEPLTDNEKLIISQYIYEDYIPSDGFLLTYLNFNPELLDFLIRTYTVLEDQDNLDLVNSFVKISKKVNREEDYSTILANLSQEDEELLEELDQAFPMGEDIEYTIHLTK
ncbi:hypothetical protein HBP58_08200 [Listeria welshimeri]|nr:hypothetical protein [Listeria welshimeri]MBC2362769.1 hypothetical protein [Listeria welshimeri]